ncbi:hypothetical protein Golax_012663, partial [Gossypium laxum]|nr:hypothetical protein [Gossypium laxum]
STASYIAAFFATTPSISFHQLPPIPLDPASYDSPDALTSDLINLNNVHVQVALTSTLRSLIIDLFCYPALEIAAHLAGNIINTFETLEPKVVKALSLGFSIPDGPNQTQTPPIFCVGPLIDTHRNGNGDEGEECLKEVFLCFGSMGLFSKDQLMEIAVGLERSGQRFLWVVSNPPPNNNKQGFSKGSHPSLEGFLDRTSDGRLVLKAWAPQVAVMVMTRWAGL